MTQMIESYITLILCRSTSQERTYNVYSRGDPRVAQARGRPVPGHTVLKKLWSDLRGNSRKYRAWLSPHKPIVYSSETLETVKHLLSQKRHHPLRQPLVGTVIAHTNNGLVAIDANGGRAYFSSLLRFSCIVAQAC